MGDKASTPRTVSNDLVRRDMTLDHMNRERALQICKTKPEEAADLIIALATQNTEALPGTSFVRRDDDTFLKKFRTTIRLSESDGTLVRVGSTRSDGKWVNSYDLSISGIRRLNEVAGLQVIRPDCVIVDGKRQMNPYIAVDPATRMPEVVYSRCLAVGYSPTGSLVASDVMIRLDINIYLLENIQSKMDKAKTLKECNNIGIYGAIDEEPVDEDGNELHGYRFFPIHSVGGIGLWVNLRSREIQKILKDHTTRLKFIERLAQSFAERNALKIHPSIPKAIDTKNGVAHVRVNGWTTDFDREDISRLRELAEDDRLDKFRDGVIDVEARVISDMDQTDHIALDGEVASEQAHDLKERDEGDEGEEEEASAEDVDLLTNAQEAYGRLLDLKGKKGAGAVLVACEIANLEEAKAGQLLKFLDMSKKAEEGNL